MSLDLFGPGSAANSVTSRPSEDRTLGSTDTFFKPCSSPSANDGTVISDGWLNQVTAVMRALARMNGTKIDGVTPVNPDSNALDSILAQAVQ